MHFLKSTLCLVILTVTAVQAPAANLTFYGIGDVPYFLPGDNAKLRRLYQALKADGGKFMVHVGDITDGISPLTDGAMLHVRDLFDEAPIPLVYTPADNCWGDAHRPSMGGYDPRERLAFLRKNFYRAGRYTFGQGRLEVVSQAASKQHGEFIENVRFIESRVMFVGLHLHNGYNIYTGKESIAELRRRNAALQSWLEEAFASVDAGDADAVVLFSQDTLFSNAKNKVSAAKPGFEGIYATVAGFAVRSGKPLLCIIGGGHRFIVEKPLILSVKGFKPNAGFEGVVEYDALYGRAALENVTQVMVPGAENVQAIRVTYDPAKRTSPFVIEEFFIPENWNRYVAP
jgi:hypothetical protein